MTDTADTRNAWTMEQHAEDHARTLGADLKRLERLEELSRADAWPGSTWPQTLAEAAEEFREEIHDRCYGAGISMTVDVIMYGGGPAGGVEFECGRGNHGLDWQSARVWHQDWFEPKGYAHLDGETAQVLWDIWGLEFLMEG